VSGYGVCQPYVNRFVIQGKRRLKGGLMTADVEIYEGGQYVSTKKMKLKVVREFSEAIIYENEQGSAVMYFKKDDKYILVSIDMA
jgi:hypothetical protein